MTLNRTYLLYSGLLLLVLVLGYWAFDGRMPTTIGERTPDNKAHPDYFLEQVSITHYNKKGRRDYLLTSSNLSHYLEKGTALLSDPYLRDYRDPDQMVDSKAVHGKWLTSTETLILWDDVVLRQDDLKTNRTVRVETNYLTIHTPDRMAETDKPVLITSNGSYTRAVGMQSFYDKGIIYLKNSVRGLHVPE
ncbi:LPS export ABC transporter periplasmic protein LptC [Candidatus Sororendozoicomonas aggregata]|uniref:LPS export ABC transporter periplasmic protein LptC n=1 Tax=Candidatus Sororendozoicomonas aggregata TaxID=3073239 RepID=UPI002ED04C61